MNVKNASLVAFIGVLLASIVLLVELLRDLMAVAQDVLPAVTFFRDLIYFVASLCVLVFLYAFRRSQ